MAYGSYGQDAPGAAGRFPLVRDAALVSQLAIITEHHGQRAVVKLQGELDVSNRDRVRRAICSAMERRPATVVVDLSGLGFTDCAGLSVLVWAHQHLAGRGHELVITGGKPPVRRLLRLTGLDTYLHLGIPGAVTGHPDDNAYV